MNKLICLTIIAIVLFMASMTSGAHLACNLSDREIQYVQVEVTYYYYVWRPGLTELFDGFYEPFDETLALLFDLTGFAPGMYIFRVRWAEDPDVWSEWSDQLWCRQGKRGGWRCKSLKQRRF